MREGNWERRHGRVARKSPSVLALIHGHLYVWNHFFPCAHNGVWWKLYGNSLQHTSAESSCVRERIAARIEFFEASSYRSIYPSLAATFIRQERASEGGRAPFA